MGCKEVGESLRVAGGAECTVVDFFGGGNLLEAEPWWKGAWQNGLNGECEDRCVRSFCY